MHTTFLPEFQIDAPTRSKLRHLLKVCFPEADYQGRDYFKQLPHGRLLLWQDEELIGQLSIDYRVMNLNGEPVKVMGAADVCVLPSLQGKGTGTYLMQAFEHLARQYPDNIDFLFLVTDSPTFYERLNYNNAKLHLHWLKIHQHKTLGLGAENISDSYFMVNAIGKKLWADGELDMLGYMY